MSRTIRQSDKRFRVPRNIKVVATISKDGTMHILPEGSNTVVENVLASKTFTVKTLKNVFRSKEYKNMLELKNKLVS